MGGAASSAQLRQGLDLLQKEVVSADNAQLNAFWEGLWTTPTSADDVFSLIKGDDIRNIRTNFPQNLALFLQKTTDQLWGPASSLRKTDGKGVLIPKPQEYAKALNAVRVLQRVLPFIFENSKDDFEERVFWKNLSPISPRKEETPKEGQQEPPKEEERPKTPKEGEEPKGKEKVIEGQEIQPVKAVKPQNEKPLAIRILDSLVTLLFAPEFTIAKEANLQGLSLPLKNIWAPGVATSDVLYTTATMVANRTEILKCLLSCFSQTLYLSPDRLKSEVNRWVEYVACFNPFYSGALFYSLVNQSLTYDPVGWGVPYNHVMFSDPEEELIDISLEVLAVLLNFNSQPPQPAPTQEGEAPQPQQVPSLAPPNAFVEVLRRITKKEEFVFLTNGIYRLLNNPIIANQTYLPNSTKRIGCHQEILMFFWRLILENQHYLSWVIIQSDVLNLLSCILHYIYFGRKDQGQVGLVNLGIFTLLVLSGERNFSVTLNRPFIGKPTVELPLFKGSYADLTILTLHRLIVDGHSSLESMWECIFTIFANISPYLKALSLMSSMKLTSLFEHFSRPSYLFSSERNHRYCHFLLEIFNNIIQYQSEGNYNLLYAIIRSGKSFRGLVQLQPPQLANLASPQEGKAGKEQPGWLTEEWLNGWKKQLPLVAPLRLLDALGPQIQDLVSGSASDEGQIIEFLQKTTLVGLLPVPHPIVIRKYQQADTVDYWFTNFMWGVIYLRNTYPPIFFGTSVKLFVVSVLNS